MLFSRSHIFLKDDRKDVRIKENRLVPWQIKYKQRAGLAKIRNICFNGMLIETDAAFDLNNECIFSFNSDLDTDNYIPQVGRLIWQKKKRFSRNKYLCGIKFVEADDQVLTRMRFRVTEGVRQFVKRQQTATVVGSLLFVVFVGIIGYVLWFSSVIYQDITSANEKILGASGQQALVMQNYTNLYRSNNIRLAEVTEKLNVSNQLIGDNNTAINLYSKELEATRSLLAQTETMLIAANDRNVELLGRGAQRKAQTPRQAAVQSQALLLSENITSVADANALILEYRSRMRSIKNGIRQLKNEEKIARRETIRQMDNQRLQVGNNGYFVKDGQDVIFNEDQYLKLTIERFLYPDISSANQKVEIDVTFFE